MVKTYTGFGEIGFEVTGKRLSRVELLPSARALRAPKSAAEKKVARLLSGYFAGKVKRFSVPLDIGNVTPFTRKVLQACYRIPFGKVVTYGELARMAGRPKASRAVGQVMAHNRIAIVIPCHRVVGSDKGLHGFGGGLEMKRRLLELEGVKVRNGKICQ